VPDLAFNHQRIAVCHTLGEPFRFAVIRGLPLAPMPGNVHDAAVLTIGARGIEAMI
jgi:hypothetical protein